MRDAAGADRAAVLLGLCGIGALSWAYLLYQDWAMRHMDIVDMAMPSAHGWAWPDFLLVFSMWAIMMVAMMLPSATPVVLLFAAVNRKRRVQRGAFVATSIFLAGYLSVWTLFSMLATLAQWWLHDMALVSPMMIATSPLLAAALLIAAGAYQWLPAKRACLDHCRSPMDYLAAHWRAGSWGAWCMGFTHGLYCTGCCWMLMALLFVLGVMNVAWIAALSAFVLIEKTVPKGLWVARGSGGLLMAWGVGMAWGVLA
ncbi:DUF2182 domain-containing protein [Noviherbaspirillum sp. UKPF54]|uniref:DUF2182 domain-containing protein n=1 Tax=Noviherbaspirillum sp. UKPF54 TaxID=2601898 RepID=UPI001AEFDC62|nr:DUF2182 domain-containing protein [Noviherbaspirillum sp. UKPF54]